MIDLPENIFRFLPFKYSSAEENDYINFWWNAYLKNFEEENYHLAFVAFHLLYMTAVYFLLYKISKIHRPVYEHSLFHMGNEEESHYRAIDSPFSFVNMNEKSVFRFLKVAGADHNFIGEVSKFIEDRNNATHAKGLIYFKDDPEGLNIKTAEYIRALEKIQNLFINESKTIADTWKISKFNKADLKLFIENEISKNNLTPTELYEIAKYEKPKREKLHNLIREFLEGFYAPEELVFN